MSKSDKSSSNIEYYPLIRTEISGGIVTKTVMDAGNHPVSAYVNYGDNYKDFRHRMARGENTTTSADGFKNVIKVVPGSLFGQFDHLFAGSVSDKWEGGLIQPSNPLTEAWNSKLYSDGLGLWVSKARSAQHRTQYGVIAGEIVKTYKLLKSPLSAFRKLTSDYEKRAKRLARGYGGSSRSNLTFLQRSKKFRRAVANEHLKWTFGVKPLLKDIDDLMYDLVQLQHTRPPQSRVKAIVRHWTREAIADGDASPDTLSYWRRRYFSNYRKSESVRFSGAVWITFQDSPEWSSDLTMSALSDFVPTVWELIPYSFLVDYFVNIQSVLSALTFLKATVAWCSVTERQEISIDNYAFYAHDPGTIQNGGVISNVRVNPGAASATSSSISWRRRAVTDFVPDFHFSLGISGNQVQNIIALLGRARSL